MWVYSDTAYITGLDPATSYDFFVTTLCSATDSSAATAALAQFTQCAAIATPWSENFDNTTTGSAFNPSLPQCWDFYTDGVGSFYYPYFYNRNYSFYANSGTNFLYGYRSSSTSTSTAYGDTTMIITPEIQGLDSATKQLEFYARTTSAGRPGEVLIGLTDAAGTPGSLTIVDTIYAPATTYSKYTVYLDGATTGDARIAFMLRRTPGTYDYICIDDVSVTDIPPCPEPIGLSLAGTTQTTGTISWSSSSAAFNIEVGPMGFTQGTGTSYSSTTTSYTATGLTQNTYYDAYVMSNCTSTGDGTSNWVGPFTFKTECGDFSVPLTEGFEGFSSGNTADPNLPDCWEYAKTGTSSSFYAYNYNYSFYSNTGNNSVRFYGYASTTSSNSADGDTLAAFSPRIAGLSGNDKQVIFNVRTSSSVAYYNSKIIIATADTNSSLGSIHIVDTVNYSSVYQEFTVDLINLPSNASRVVFMIVPEFVSGYTYSYTYAYLDDIEIRDIPACPEASDIVGTATSDTSFTFSWSDSSTVSQYVIEWGPTGFTQGTGIPYDSITGANWSIDTLTSNTTYDLYIQSICPSQGMNSPWYGPVTVTTPCSPVSTPWSDGFENSPSYSGGNGNPNLPSCWTYDGNVGNSYSMGYGYSYYANSGSYSLYNYMYSNGGDTNVVSTPLIKNLEEGGFELSFYARTSSTNYPGVFDVVLTDIEGRMESARLVQSISLSGNTSYQQFKVYLDSNVVQDGDRRVGFRFYSKTNTYDYVYIDDVEINDIPSCFNYNHEVSNITSSGGQGSWSYMGSNCFNIEYGPSGFVQGTGIGSTVSNVSVPHTFSNLNQNTTYDYYVQNCCTNQWEGPFSFTTECSGPLSGGVYTVGSTGSFETIDSAFTVLNNCGISGPITLQLLSGYHVPSVELGSINGSSASNTVTIKGSASASDTLRNIVFNGTSYLTLSDLSIKSNGGYAIRLNGTSHINITGNTIISPQSSSSSVIGIVASESSTSYSSGTEGETYLTISDNDIQGGYFAINLYGNSSYLNTNISITNNTITDAYYYGLYIYYARDVEVSDNTITDFSNTYNYGAYLYRLDGGLITRNEFNSYYSLYTYYFSTTSEASIQSEISNNMFYGGYYGMRVYYGSNLKVYHNSIVGSYYGLYDYNNTSDVDIRNNIIQGGTYSLYSYYSSASRDYNLYYGLGSNLAYVSGSYASDLTALQAFDSSKDQNSLSGDPIFVSATDLHATGVLPHNNGDDSATVSLDFDGEARPSGFNSNPDIGADEFEIFTSQNFTSALDTSICFGDSITLTTNYTNSSSSLWTSGESSQSITVVATSDSAVYTIQTSSDSVRFEQFIIRAYTLPEAYLSSTGTIYKCEEDSVDISAYGTNGTYAWNNSLTTATVTIASQGSYWFTVTDSNACSSISDTLNLVDYSPISSQLTWNNPDTSSGGNVGLVNLDTIVTCFGTSVSLSSSSDASTTYWSTGDSAATLFAEQSGAYYATTWSSNGCIGTTDTVFVQVKAQLPDSILTASLVQRCIDESALLTIGSGSNLMYSWNTGATSNQISVSTNGDYFATITDDFGCSATTDTVEFLNYDDPNDTVWASSATTFCDGNTVLLSVSNNSIYSWNTGDSTQNISIGASGSYWAQVTDSNGCSVQTDTIVVTANPLPLEVITNTGSAVYCDGDSTVLMLTGQNTYQWSNGDSTDDISVFTSGDYFAMLTDSNGCQSYSDTVAITVNALPSDSLVISGNTEFCQGDSVIVAALTNVSYIWNTGDTTQQVAVSSTSAITGMVTDANGCTRQLDTALITVNPLPNDSIYATGPTTFCLGDSVVILSADASAMHLWNTLDTSSSIVATSSGAYYVGLVTNKGCIGASDTIDVVANPNPNASITINGSLDLCPGDSVELIANQGLTYYWTTGDSTQAITVAQTGNFVVDVTNGFGCTKASTVQSVVLHPFPQTSVILGDTTGIIPLQQYTYVVTQTLGNTYNWTAINGAVVSGQGTNIASVIWSQDTVGSLQVVESNGYCTDTSSLSIRTNIGLNEYGLRNVELFPNPTQGNVFISADEPLGEIKVYAATGALVTSKYTTETSVHFDFSTLSAGVYWITIGTERYRLVVMH
jgi:hypothetical protein